MSAENDSKLREELESQVWSAIAAFEQIVQTIPNDRVSLEALSHAYEQVGDLARSRDFLVRLVDVVVVEKDRDAADLLRERLERHAASSAEAKSAQARLEAFLAQGRPDARSFDVAADLGPDDDGRESPDSERPTSHVAAELSFAWTLFQAGELTQEEYATVAQDLSEVSASKSAVTVSVLHVLQDRGNRNVERIVAYAARDTGVPMIPLSLFDVQPAVIRLLPSDFEVRHGAMPFEVMGTAVLVVILNPYNKALRKKVETIIGRACHFYLTLPTEFDAVMERLGGREDNKPRDPGATP